jgi:hypothetical protein
MLPPTSGPRLVSKHPQLPPEPLYLVVAGYVATEVERVVPERRDLARSLVGWLTVDELADVEVRRRRDACAGTLAFDGFLAAEKNRARVRRQELLWAGRLSTEEETRLRAEGKWPPEGRPPRSLHEAASDDDDPRDESRDRARPQPSSERR